MFSETLCWFTVSAQEGGSIINYCTVIAAMEGSSRCTAPPMATAHGWDRREAFARQGRRCCPHRQRHVRLEAQGGSIQQTRSFPDTEPFVNAETRLYTGSDGIYAVTPHEIRLLSIS